MSRSLNREITNQLDEGNLNWPQVADLPNGMPSVMFFFAGLMGFAYNNHGFCEIGVHSKAPKHEFCIKVYDDSSTEDKPIYAFKCGPAQNSPVDIIRLDVVNPTSATKEVAFLTSPNTRFDPRRGKIIDHPMDFRLLLDLEGPELYKRKLGKKPGAFKPRMFLKSGIIGAVAGDATFKVMSPSDSHPIGQVGSIVIAFIYLNDDGYVSLRIGSNEVKLTADKKYLVLFDNRCPKTECVFNPESNKKEERNDFYLYAETFEIPEDLEEYELVRDSPNAKTALDEAQPEQLRAGAAALMLPAPYDDFNPAVKTILDDISVKTILGVITSTNDAPCGGAGYGGSNGLGDGTL